MSKKTTPPARRAGRPPRQDAVERVVAIGPLLADAVVEALTRVNILAAAGEVQDPWALLRSVAAWNRRAAMATDSGSRPHGAYRGHEAPWHSCGAASGWPPRQTVLDIST